MSGMSRRKGVVGELDACRAWGALGFPAKRGYQFIGGESVADIEFDDELMRKAFHTEVKRRERLNVRAAFQQCEADAGIRFPMLMHRPSREPWLVTLRIEDLTEILRDGVLD